MQYDISVGIGGNMNKDERSIYETIYPEDSRQYRELAKRYMDINVDKYAEAFEITKKAWALAQRWSDIQSNASVVAIEHGVKKTELSAWAYQRYRQLQNLHEHARMVWGVGERELGSIERQQNKYKGRG